jgi:hypothetical protein
MRLLRRLKFRDVFFTTLALIILYQQVFVATAAQPLLIFLVIFLFACIPALRGDGKDGDSLLQRFVLNAMGIRPPSEDDRPSFTGSSSDTPTPSESRSSAESERSSHKR